MRASHSTRPSGSTAWIARAAGSHDERWLARVVTYSHRMSGRSARRARLRERRASHACDVRGDGHWSQRTDKSIEEDDEEQQTQGDEESRQCYAGVGNEIVVDPPEHCERRASDEASHHARPGGRLAPRGRAHRGTRCRAPAGRARWRRTRPCRRSRPGWRHLAIPGGARLAFRSGRRHQREATARGPERRRTTISTYARTCHPA